MEKIEKLEKLIEKCGLSRENIVLQWARQGLIDLSEIQKDIKPEVKIVYITDINDLQPGMFFYGNYQVSPEYADNALGVIFGLDDANIFVLSLEGENLPFSRDGFNIESGDFGSLSATHFLVQMADSYNKNVEAAKYCLEYSNSIVSCGSAFLLSDKDISRLQKNSAAVHTAFKTAGISDTCLWTCGTAPMEEPTKACFYSFNGGYTMSEVTTIPLPVHPAFVVKKSQIKNRISL